MISGAAVSSFAVADDGYFAASGAASVPEATGTSTGSGTGGEATAGSGSTPASVPSATGTSTGSGSGGAATVGTGPTPASVPSATGTSTGSGSGGAASSPSLTLDSNLRPSHPLYLFYVGWPAVEVVYKPKIDAPQLQARAIFDQPASTIINNDVLYTDLALRFPAVSFPSVRKGDSFTIAGQVYFARDNAQPGLDGLEHFCPLSKALAA